MVWRVPPGDPDDSDELERLTGFDEGPVTVDWIEQFERRGISVTKGVRLPAELRPSARPATREEVATRDTMLRFRQPGSVLAVRSTSSLAPLRGSIIDGAEFPPDFRPAHSSRYIPPETPTAEVHVSGRVPCRTRVGLRISYVTRSDDTSDDGVGRRGSRHIGSEGGRNP